MTLLRELLQVKGSLVYTISPEATLAEVVDRLNDHNCGSLVVCQDGRMVGIITDRDILRACAKLNGAMDQARVADHMTRDVITGTPEDRVAEVMGLMTDKRIRHLPLLEGGNLCGLISIGDVVKAQHQQVCVENYYLKSYIQS